MGDQPLCFVLMPFGKKDDPAGGGPIDFDAIYQEGIAPAIEAAGLEAIRADAEVSGGIIHKPMYERLLLCDYAIADMTTANANVFYELGIRHAAKPHTTVTIFATNLKMPFDVNFLRSLPYELASGNKFNESCAAQLLQSLTKRLKDLKKEAVDGDPTDSPLFQLLEGYRAPEVAHLKTDIFRDQVRYSQKMKERLAEARTAGEDKTKQLREVEKELGDLSDTEAGILVDLFLSYRSVKEWKAMITLYERLPASLRRTVLIREQLAFALNRAGDGDRALEILDQIEKKQGPSSETCGLMGRVYKDRWTQAKKAGKTLAARSNLKKAIEAYQRGFEADWRDHYPGVNAVTLLDIRGEEENLAVKDELLPVVRYSASRRLQGEPDYWDYATLLELDVLADDEESAADHLADAVTSVRETWEPETTINNLKMIQAAHSSSSAKTSSSSRGLARRPAV